MFRMVAVITAAVSVVVKIVYSFSLRLIHLLFLLMCKLQNKLESQMRMRACVWTPLKQTVQMNAKHFDSVKQNNRKIMQVSTYIQIEVFLLSFSGCSHFKVVNHPYTVANINTYHIHMTTASRSWFTPKLFMQHPRNSYSKGRKSTLQSFLSAFGNCQYFGVLFLSFRLYWSNNDFIATAAATTTKCVWLGVCPPKPNKFHRISFLIRCSELTNVLTM